jgi:hypothetical protein
MKIFVITLAVAGAVAAGSAAGQAPPRSPVYQPNQTTCSYNRTSNSVGDVIFGRTNSASNCEDVYSRDDGAWYQVGRGPNNNSIYERRITDSRGNLVIQRARRNPNGTFTILSSRTARSSDKQWKKAQKAREKAWEKQQKEERRAQRTSNDCTYSRTTNSVGDIIFGRSGSNATNCVDNRNTRVNGAWYPVSNDGNGGTIYERQTRDSNGNLIIQRARRDRNGNLSIISTRNAGVSSNGTYDSRDTNRRYEAGQYNSRQDGDDDHDEGNGRGKGHGKGHGKAKGHGRG